MKQIFAHFCRFSAVLAMVGGVSSVRADQAPNPRSAVAVNNTTARGEANVVKRGDGVNANVVSSRARVANRRSAGVVSARTGTVPRAARSGTAARYSLPAIMRDVTSARSATSVARSAVPGAASNPRGGMDTSLGASRAASRSRAATAVFTDISKIGGGYSQCRDAYATCMDQFCANANDTYRRCFCSSRFTEFRDTEDALDQAMTLLQRFEDTSLNAVDKTAAEVNAMYSATVGEAAIKNDTSAAQNILNEIGDLLSGKKKASTTNAVTPVTSLGSLSLDFSSDMGDVWGGGDVFSSSSSSMFDMGSRAVDMTTLEGKSLFNESNKQCMQLMSDNCSSSAVLNMATSAYNIMITQDCNMYEKSLNSKREKVLQTVRQAEKILREARLEEYRAHNSQDVNECLDRVRTAMTQPMACGAKWERCLDYTGSYINQQTGEPIYSPILFKLVDIIKLDGVSADVFSNGNNAEFSTFLETKKMFAKQALDTCRDLSDVVWNEFKRSALIEIAQAQDEKIEEVKMSCVSTVAECYDKQTGALRDFDTTTAQVSGAMSVYAAKAMCQDKLTACAALYSPTGCTFENGKLTNENACGLKALLSFVDNVDNVRVAEGCASAIDSYLTELCTPTGEAAKNQKYPWNCRKYSIDTTDISNFTSDISGKENNLAALVAQYAIQYCGDPTNGNKTDYKYGALPAQTRSQVERSLSQIEDELDHQLAEVCESMDGIWEAPNSTESVLNRFYSVVYGGIETTHLGRCLENTERVACLSFNLDPENPVATYDVGAGTCEFAKSWYETQCNMIGGLWKDNACYY